MEGNSQSSLPLQLIKSRWIMAVVSLYILFCSGATYLFGLYSGAIKQALHYNQETLDTLSFFKDIGANVGIVAALISEVVPPWAVLIVGAAMNLFGYLMIWLAVTHRIAQPPTWHMYLFICIGANSQSFANVAVLVTFVKNFPKGRGEVLGIIKGCVGLSGAVFTQIYLAIYGEDTRGVILLIGWVPSLVSLIFMFVIRPITPVYDKRETRTMYYFLYLALVLAAFLTVVILVENELHHIPSAAYKAFAALTLIFIVSNMIIGVRAEYAFRAEAEEGRASTTEGKLVQELCTAAKTKALTEDGVERVSVEDTRLCNSHKDQAIHTLCHENDAAKPQEGTDSVRDPGRTMSNGINCASSASKEGQPSCLPWKLKIFTKFFKHWPERGEDFTIPQALFSMDMWILFVATSCGLGATLTAIDNMGQIGESQGYEAKNIQTFVSLISIWNFLGRVMAGFISEIVLRCYHVPRTLVFTIVIGMACVGHLLIAFPMQNTLYIASIMVGLCFGAQLPLFLAITSELFGLKYYATLQSLGSIASPLGSYLLNVRVAGHLYDREAQRQHSHTLVPTYGDLKCIGPQCFRLTFLIMTLVTAFGCLASSFLVLRTKKFYSEDIYSKFHLTPNNPESQAETCP